MDDLFGVGDLIDGRYEVARSLSGGMGVVYLCLDPQGNRSVAVKTMLPGLAGDGWNWESFLQEAAVWTRISPHPNVVHAEDVFLGGPGRVPHLVLEFVAAGEGLGDASLTERLRRGRGLPREEALKYGLDIARGMRHAGDCVHGLVHRDLKPANILVGPDGNAKVTDFGLALAIRSIGSGALFRTVEEGDRSGTPSYMAPEQWSADPVDARADLYSFGVILYEMLTGVHVMAAHRGGLEQLRAAHQAGMAERAPIPQDWPDVLRELVLSCMALTPERRPSSWAETEAALAAAWTASTARPLPAAPTEAAISATGRLTRSLSLYSLGQAASAIGRGGHALGFYLEALELARAEKVRSVEAMVWNNVGNILRDRGRYGEALAAIDESLRLHRGLDDRRSVAGALLNRGNLLEMMGRCDVARVNIRESAARFEELGDRLGLALVWLAMAADQGSDALHHAEAALAVFQEMGDRRHQAAAFSRISSIHRKLGDPVLALEFSERGLDLALQISDRVGAAIELMNQGYLHLDINPGGLVQAILCWYRSLELADLTGRRLLVGQNTYALATHLSKHAHPRRNPAEYEIVLGLARHAVRAYGDCRRPELESDAVALVFHMERKLDLLRQMGTFVNHGDPRPEYAPGAAYLAATNARFTGKN